MSSQVNLRAVKKVFENIIGTDTYFRKIKMNSNNDFSKNVHRNWGQASQLHKI